MMLCQPIRVGTDMWGLQTRDHIFKLLINQSDDIMIKSELRRILDTVADLSQKEVNNDVLEAEIISHSGLSDLEGIN